MGAIKEFVVGTGNVECRSMSVYGGLGRIRFIAVRALQGHRLLIRGALEGHLYIQRYINCR